MEHLPEIRLRQARRLHKLIDPRYGPKPSFENYLSLIPELRPGVGDPTFFDKPLLMERNSGILRACAQARVNRLSPHITFIRKPAPERPPFYWIWCHDGSKRMNMSPENTVYQFGPDEFPLGAEEGLAFHAQYPDVARERFVDLPGSEFCEDTATVASLGPWCEYNKTVWLHFIGKQERHHRCGCASYCLARDSDPG